MSDAFKFCSGDIPDESAIETCLRRNGRRLSSACQLAMGVSAPGEATTRRASRSIATPEPEAADQPMGAIASAAGDAPVVDERPAPRRHDRHHRRRAGHAHHRHHGSGFGVGDLAGMAEPAMAVMPMLASLFEDGGPSLDDDD
ncbi:hypothetical protein [Methylosinus sp. Sm6]|uniref:hypothetical protein n=1 Tax=Methylosinus sp. Sm6 TaxID=2866948 RepID=UPI001C98F16E|nr:hypothetical protein [Methylosinus sp. Sm6]MBY6241378.1 hypothetical protein [Methylosinus sp. Sm6]